MPGRRSRPLLVPAIVAAGVYAGTLAHPLLYDDARALRLLETGTAPSLFPPTFGRALAWALFELEHALWGGWSPGYHAVSIALHALAAALAAAMARSLSGNPFTALATGLLFAIHPVHSEVVASFANNKDSLAFLFVALALLAWRRSHGYDGAYAIVLVALVLGVFSKEVAVVALPAALFVHDRISRLALAPLPTPEGRVEARHDDARGSPDGAAPARSSPAARTSATRLAPLVLLVAAAAALFAKSKTLPGVGDALNSIYVETGAKVADGGAVAMTSLGSLAEQLRLLLWPARLSADYPPIPRTSLTTPVLFGIVAWLAAAASVLLLARRAPLVAFGVAWTALMYAPSSNLIPVTHHFVAERYLYVPSFGVCLIAAAVLARIRDRGNARTATAVLALLTVLGGARTLLRTHDWRSGEALWTAVLDAGYETPRAHNALAHVFAQRGDHERAIAEYERSAALLDTDEARYNLAWACWRAGREARALRHLERILAVNPDHARAASLLEEIRSGAEQQ